MKTHFCKLRVLSINVGRLYTLLHEEILAARTILNDMMNLCKYIFKYVLLKKQSECALCNLIISKQKKQLF